MTPNLERVSAWSGCGPERVWAFGSSLTRAIRYLLVTPFLNLALWGMTLGVLFAHDSMGSANLGLDEFTAHPEMK